MKRLWIAVAVWATVGFSPLPHDFHVTYGRVGIEGSIVQARIRFFRDDLQDALRAFSGNPELRLAANAGTDSLFLAYFGRHFKLTSDTDDLEGSIAGSGDEVDGRESVWWYLMHFEAPTPVRSLTVRSTLLFDQFDDQKNIVKIQHFPSEKEATYYLTPEDPSQTFRVE